MEKSLFCGAKFSNRLNNQRCRAQIYSIFTCLRLAQSYIPDKCATLSWKSLRNKCCGVKLKVKLSNQREISFSATSVLFICLDYTFF